VLGLAHEDGAILPEELLPVADACGQTPEQIRSCLRRLVAEGLFVRAEGNRREPGTFQATTAGLAALGATMERTRRAYHQDLAGAAWDRQWRLAAFAVPESRRRDRNALRDRLLSLGGAAVQGGLYVSPHPWLKDVRAEASLLGLADLVATATSDDLEVGGEHDPKEIARRLWPVELLAARYQAFVDRYRELPGVLSGRRKAHRRLSDAEFLPGALAMAVSFQECFDNDPLLPPELLPRPWPGRKARDLLAASRRLALSIRQSAGRPALFRLYDHAIDVLPLGTDAPPTT
jgi:phenylacetic acid degradation operon negative regulatory protein